MPVEVTSNNRRANSLGRRMQPCEAGITRQSTRVQCDAAPGQALHVGHGRVVVDVGEVILVLLQDGEHAGRRLVPLLAGAHRAHAGEHAIAVHVGELFVDAHDQQQRTAARGVAEPDELALLEITRRGVCRARFARTPERRLGRQCAARQPRGQRADRPRLPCSNQSLGLLVLLVALLDLFARLRPQLPPFGFLRGVEHAFDLRVESVLRLASRRASALRFC